MSLSIINRNRMICLFDCYGNLLTEKQKILFNYYFNDDLSLAEISDLMGISRQAVHNSISRCEDILENYEASLGIFARANSMESILDKAIKTIEGSLETNKWSEKEYSTLLAQLKTIRKAD